MFHIVKSIHDSGVKKLTEILKNSINVIVYNDLILNPIIKIITENLDNHLKDLLKQIISLTFWPTFHSMHNIYTEQSCDSNIHLYRQLLQVNLLQMTMPLYHINNILYYQTKVYSSHTQQQMKKKLKEDTRHTIYFFCTVTVLNKINHYIMRSHTKYNMCAKNKKINIINTNYRYIISQLICQINSS